MPCPSPTLALLDAILEAALRWAAPRLLPYLPPRRPRAPRATLIREADAMLFYAVNLPPATAPDITKWEASFVVNSGPESVFVVVEGQELPGVNDNDVVTLKVRAYGDEQPTPLASEWSPENTFTAVDTIAPPAPGAPGVKLVREA